MKSAISRASSSITASTGLSDSAQIVRGGSNLTTVGAIPYVQSSGVLTQSAGLTFSDAANVRLATLAGGSSQSTSALLDVTNSAGSSHWLTVLGDGKVGVGTNAPAAVRLDVLGATYRTMNLTAPSASGGASIAFIDGGTPSTKNWIFGANLNAGNTFEITPSTAVGGTTFSTPIATFGVSSIGLGLMNKTPASATTLSILDATASTGATTTWIGHDGSGTYSGVHLSALTTSLKVVAGLTQSTTNLQEWQNNAGSVLAGVDFGGNISGAQLNASTNVRAGSTGAFFWNTRSIIYSPANSKIQFTNAAADNFDMAIFGLETSSFPALKRSTTGLIARLADDSSDTWMQGSRFQLTGGQAIYGGAGSPESAVTAVVGSLFLRTDGGASTTLYVKESGSGNTGWIAK